MRFLGLAPGLVLALLATVALTVVALYLLKPSPRRAVLSSNLIWERVLKGRKRRPDRLRWWMSLLLALAVALCLAVALTRPEIAAVSGNAERVVLVLDNSATMGTRMPDARARLEHARAEARTTIRSGGPGSRYLVADTMRRIGVPTFEPPEAALRRIDEIRVIDGGQPRFPGVARPSDPGQRQRALFFTDGVADIAPPPGFDTVPVFQLADNVGITAFDIRPVPASARRIEGYVEVLNASPGNQRIRLQVAGVGAPPLERTLQLAGGARASAVLDVSGFDAGPLRASVTADRDSLDLDNSAYAFAPSKRVTRLVLVTRGNAQLERSLRLVPRLQVVALAPERFRAASAVDAAVFDRWVPADPPRVPALLIRPTQAVWLPPRVGELPETNLEIWDRTHPALRYLSLRDVTVERALHVQPRTGAGETGRTVDVLAAGPGGQPLMLASDTGSRWLELTFALEDSNFPLQQAFPIFLANTLGWMTGEPLAIERTLGVVEVPGTGLRVLDLAGREVRTQTLPKAIAFEAHEPGLYTAIGSGQRVRVAVNLLESRVTAVNDSPFARELPALPHAPALARVATEPWVLLLVLAAFLLAFEWIAYHRRVTI